MAQIKNKYDIQNSIADDMVLLSRRLPNYFDNSDDMNTFAGIILSAAIHALLALIIFIMSLLGITFPHFNLPDLPNKDIEFKLVQQESKPPINKNTKIRADRDSQAGGKHDPKRAISEPSSKGTNKPKTATKKAEPVKQTKPQNKPAQKQPQQVQKPVQKPQPKQVQKPVQKQQVQKPAPIKPSPIKAPNTNIKPTVNSSSQSIAKPSAPKIAAAPKSPFAVPVPTKAPAGSTYRPAGAPTSGASSGLSQKGSSVPAPKFSTSTGGSAAGSSGTSRPASGGSYASRGASGGYGSGGNPSPGNPNGTPGIDAVRQPNWGPYMRNLERRIKQNWNPPKGDSSKRVVINFTISRDGRLLSKRIVKSSGVPLADRAAMSAIEQTAPFSPLPPEFKGQSVPIEFTFDYNVLNSVMK